MLCLQGVSVQKWQYLGMGCRSVRTPWSQSSGLRSDILGEVRKREKERGGEKPTRVPDLHLGASSRLGGTSWGKQGRVKRRWALWHNLD